MGFIYRGIHGYRTIIRRFLSWDHSIMSLSDLVRMGSKDIVFDLRLCGDSLIFLR